MTKCLPRLSEPGTGLHTAPPSARVQTLHKASHKQMQNYTLSILHVCIYTFMTPLQHDWKSAIFVSAAGDGLTLDEYTDSQK